jgi:hypothetical protein
VQGSIIVTGVERGFQEERAKYGVISSLFQANGPRTVHEMQSHIIQNYNITPEEYAKVMSELVSSGLIILGGRPRIGPAPHFPLFFLL